MIKKCSKCGEEKPATVEYFHKNGNGLCTKCKVCVKAYNKAHYEVNRGRKKLYREARKETKAEYDKAYREANKETIAEQKKAYYEEHKEAIAERDKAYYRTPKGKFRMIKKGAKERDINFSLPFKLYESQLWGKPCHYCGCEIEATGLDRKDSNRGYTPDNVVPCCFDCNTKKNTKPYQVFIEEMRNE